MMSVQQLVLLVAGDQSRPLQLLYWLDRLPKHVTTVMLWNGAGQNYQGIPRPDWMVYLANLVKRPLPRHLVDAAYDAVIQSRDHARAGTSRALRPCPLIDCVDVIRNAVPGSTVFA